ncbi:MAG: hypothetical protein AAB343_00295 [Patescibacteria group bacterium]
MIRWIIIFVLVIIILSLLGVNIASLFNDHTVRENFSYVTGKLVELWQTYLKPLWGQFWGAVR